MKKVDLDKASEELTTLLLHLNKKVFNAETILKSFPIPPSHVKVIFYLAHNKPASISKIARELCISKPNMTPIIDKLIAQGLANRYEDPKDRRVLMIELTPKAHELFHERNKLIKAALSKKLTVLEEDDLAALCTSITTLSSIISKI